MKIHTTTYGPALRKALSAAEFRVWISVYVATLNFRKKNDMIYILFRSLQRKLDSGIDVRLLVDRPRLHKPNYHAGRFLIRRLKEWYFPFWLAPAGHTLHAKVILIDDRQAFIGSHNLAKSSLLNPLEMTVEATDRGTIDAVDQWFTAIFQDPHFEYFPAGKYEIGDMYP